MFVVYVATGNEMEITWTCKDTLTPNARYTHDCKYNLGQECETFIGGHSSIKPLREETSMFRKSENG